MMVLVIGTYYALYLPGGLDLFLTYEPKISFYNLYTFCFIFYMNALVRFNYFSSFFCEYGNGINVCMCVGREGPEGPFVCILQFWNDFNFGNPFIHPQVRHLVVKVCYCSTGESVYLRRSESRVLSGVPPADVAEKAGRLFEGPCAEQI